MDITKSIISGATKQRKMSGSTDYNAHFALGKMPLSASCFMRKLMGKERPFVKKCGASVFLCKKTCESKDKVLN